MTAARWSPTDLRRQRFAVRGIAARALEDRRRLLYARRELGAKLHAAIRSPAALAGCFAAGWLVALAAGRRSKPKGVQARTSSPGWRERIGKISTSALWLMQQYKQGERLAANLSALRKPPTDPPPEPEAAGLSQPPFAT
jgi:hypothetical protein